MTSVGSRQARRFPESGCDDNGGRLPRAANVVVGSGAAAGFGAAAFGGCAMPLGTATSTPRMSFPFVIATILPVVDVDPEGPPAPVPDTATR